MTTPPFLKPGDKVSIVAPAGKLKDGSIADGLEVLSSWGLNVMPGTHLFAQHGYFAGTDLQRLSDLQEAISNPEISAIFAARGGYGTARLLDKLDFTPLEKNPKWIVGFSDITALHCHLFRLGHCSVHGQVLTQLGKPDAENATHHLKSLLLGQPISYSFPTEPANRAGECHGRLIGGNLTVFCSIMGSASQPDTADKILFLEDIGEPLYRVDRSLNQLYRSGLLSRLAGLVIGDFSAEEDTTTFGMSLQDIVQEYTAPFGYPVCFGAPFGHQPANYPLLCGGMAYLKVSHENSLLQFSPSLSAASSDSLT